MKPIQYDNFTSSPYAYDVQAEVEAALACSPNGAFFGSPYHRTPIPYGLWVWNAFSNSKSRVGKWLASSIGHAPVLVSDVNPELRISVAETVLRNNGYFQGKVNYQLHESRFTTTKTDSVVRPRKGRIAYDVDMGPLYTLDSISYVGFSDDEMSIIRRSEPLIKRGDPFNIAALDAERTRIYTTLRENGYYFYQQSYSTYVADTLQAPHKVQLQLHKVDSLPEEASRKWMMGRVQFRIRREPMEQLTDTVSRRFLTVMHGGKKSPLRPRVVLQDMRLRPGNIFCQSDLDESLKRLTGKGIFSAVDISFVPRRNDDGTIKTLGADRSQVSQKGEDRSGASILETIIDCTLDKPFDASLQGNFTQKTSGRGGPGVGLSFGRRNAFRGGENLSFNLSASVDFPIGNKGSNTSTNYDVHGDVTLELPRMLLPNFIKPNRKWFSIPNTIVRLSAQSINRSGFYRRNILSAELSYNFRPKETVQHTFTPLAIDYSYIASRTEKFDSIIEKSVYNIVLTQDNFIPKMRYTFNYISPSSYRNPIGLSLSVTESGNLTCLAMTAFGKKWNEYSKRLFGAPVAQFVKFEADWRKKWSVGKYSNLLAHLYGGYVHSYANSNVAPVSELFYMGGANDLRGFATRSVGPGSVHVDDRDMQYVVSLGDIKLLGNIEYRPRIFGSLYGALFLDFGNTWDTFTGDDPVGPHFGFHFKHLLNDIAVDAGIGIRYDLDFFVLRLDWGFILHAPYDTGHSGYFNTPKFSQAQCLNFAIGYPF